MKILLLVTLTVFSFSTFATSGYKLQMNVLMDGKLVSSPELIVEKDKKAMLIQENADSKVKTEISILASEGNIDGNTGILLDMSVAQLIGDDRTIISAPQILVSEGKEALFESSNADGTDKFELKVVPTRVLL